MFDVVEKSVKEIKEALNSNKVTSYQLVESYLERIALIDQGEIKYNSILEVNPDCLFIAKQKDYERSINKNLGFLHGIPVILKDNINTAGKMHTTAGSVAMQNHFAKEDASIVKRLKEEGAIILGKANLTEFANFMTTNMRNGYSSLGKEVLCPYNLNYDPSGSSAGSAVSVSINVTPLAIGTETGGSIMSPSMQNGIVGLKPTIGLVSRQGIIPISTTLDTAGPMVKTVYDCALLLSAIRGNDQKDVVTLSKEEKRVDYTTCLDHNNPKKLRVLVDQTNLDKLSKKRQDAYKNVIKTLKSNGVTIIEDIPIKQTKSIYQIMIYEFKRAINSYLSNEDIKDIQSLKDIINYNINHEKEALKYGQVLLEEAEYNTSGRCFEKEYIDALKERSEARKLLKELFTKHNLDAIYFATYTSLAPHTGFPSMTVPVGLDENNIPIGTYLLGNEFKEENLLQVAHVIEQNIQGRTNPLKDNEPLNYAEKDI